MSKGESSRASDKRMKKQLLAAILVAEADKNPNAGVRISDGGSNPPLPNAEEVPNAGEGEENEARGCRASSKNTRGKAKMGYIGKGEGSAAPVDVNFKGQPIGDNAPKLATLLGATVRELVPITAESLTKDKQLRDQLWEHVKQKFDVAEAQKKYVFAKMGKMWRDHRSATVRDVKEEAKKSGLNRAIAKLKPRNVDSMDEWKDFMKKMCSAEYEEKCAKFKQMRASQTLPHTTSRKGYARLEEELRKKADNPDDIKRVDVWFKGHEPKDGIYKNDKAKETMEKVQKVIDESSEDQYSIADDAVSKVIGPERRGRIRGLGFGATQTKLQRSSYHRDKVSKLEFQMKEMNARMNQMDELLRKKAVTPMPEPSGPSGPSDPSGLEGRKCHILDWVSGSVVGKGEIASTDPKSLVHHLPVGKGCWKIWVLEVFDNTAACFRPTREFFLLHEALSSTVAWSSDFIRVIDS